MVIDITKTDLAFLPASRLGERFWAVRKATVAFLGLISIAAVVFEPPASAGEPNWPKTNYDYLVIDEDLRTLLLRFGANTGIRMALSDKVQGHLHGRLQSEPPRQFLDDLAHQFALDWYYDGTTLWISAASEASTKMLSLRGVRFDHMRSSFSRMNLSDPRFTLREGPTPGIAVAAGPPRYIALVDEVLDALVAGLPQPATPQHAASRSVMIIRGSAVSRVEFP